MINQRETLEGNFVYLSNGFTYDELVIENNYIQIEMVSSQIRENNNMCSSCSE